MKARKFYILSAVCSAILVAFCVLYALTDGFWTISIQHKGGLNEYSLAELKVISEEIASAESDEEGEQIAKSYNLILDDGSIDSNQRMIITSASEDVKYSLSIIGFRQEEKADGSGKAGITLCFNQPVLYREMNSEGNEAASWEDSSLRAWLNSEFYKCFVSETFVKYVVPVKKRTIEISLLGDTEQVSVTNDLFWPLSVSELYGYVENAPLGEGDLYEPAASMSSSQDLFYPEDKESANYWLRTSFCEDQLFYYTVEGFSSLTLSSPLNARGVMPAFCI